MKNDVIVINAGPLILLDKIDALEIAGALPCRFVCPPAVRREVDAGIHRNNSPIRPDWLTVQPLISPMSRFADLAIDEGEAEVIQLALEAGDRLAWAVGVGEGIGNYPPVEALYGTIACGRRQVFPAVD